MRDFISRDNFKLPAEWHESSRRADLVASMSAALQPSRPLLDRPPAH
jgi:hypothetical protein